MQSDGGSLREIARFPFPRQEGREHLCLADYFRSAESGDVDVAAFQIVTVGDEATRRFEALQERGEFTEAYYVHGLGVEAAEASAEWMHRMHSPRAGIPASQGKRYSWGYGACPDLEEHAQLFKLLPADRGARHGAHIRIPADARAVDGGDHRASPAGEVLRGSRCGGETEAA